MGATATTGTKIAATRSVALVGMDGHIVDVEVAMSSGLPSFTIVGLPDPSIQEARERVRAAVASAGEKWELARVTVNLSPAHLRKAGSSFDLAMAIAILVADRRIPPESVAGSVLLGELSLDGTVRRVRGVLPAALAAARAGARRLFVPAANAREAAIVRDLDVVPVDHLRTLVRALRGDGSFDLCDGPGDAWETFVDDVDMRDVRGNVLAKRACEVAAAGGHNLLMTGAPGGGKTMLARRLATILPPLSEEEAFEVTRVYSVAGLLPEDRALITRRPFRSPHHSASTTGLVGGGSGLPHPGEVTLAHRGVLFLDEFGEFRREALQSLRQPIEDGVVTIVRAKWAVRFPARFMLVAASNPCPCGFNGDPLRACRCLPARVLQYQERLRGPIADRIDLQVCVERLRKQDIFAAPEGDPSTTIAARVTAARSIQSERWRALGVSCNADLPPKDIAEICGVEPRARRAIEAQVERHGLSARGAHRVCRVARTIADLGEAPSVTEEHAKEAMTYRVLDTLR